jgi:hypothetical protein
MQVTVFMALLVLDSRRLQRSHFDCLPCISSLSCFNSFVL